MLEIESSIDQITKNYIGLLNIAEENFNKMKVKDYENHQKLKVIEDHEFNLLLQNKKKLIECLKNEAVKRNKETLKVSELLNILETEGVQVEEVKQKVKEMIEIEKKYKNQLTINIEFAQTMKDIYAEQVEISINIAKQETKDRSGSVLLEDDY